VRGLSAARRPADPSRAVAQLQQELVVLARDNERSLRNSSILDAAGEGIVGADENGMFILAIRSSVPDRSEHLAGAGTSPLSTTTNGRP